MSNSLFFLSYSRHELYFAEGVALALQKAGLKIWFDLQQLEPGCNWPASIQEGLEKCSGVIVIVSRAALNSPYVAGEWEHAVANNKPIYLVIFEPVHFEAVRVTVQDQPREIHNQTLLDSAKAIVDARSAFAANVARLSQALTGNPVRDAVPAPNRWNLPTNLPLALWIVIASLALVAGLFALLTVQAVAVNWTMVGGCALTAGWIVNRLWAFMQRRSYREARLILLLAVPLSAIYLIWVTPIVLAGAILAFTSPDIDRYSPLTQGLSRNRNRNIQFHSQRRQQAHGFWNRLAVFYGRSRWIVIIRVPLLALSLVMILLFGGLGLLTLLSSSSGASNTSTDLLYIAIAIPFIAFLVIHFRLGARYRQLVLEGLGTADATGLTYRIVSAEADSKLSERVQTAMAAAGHRSIDFPTSSFTERLWGGNPKAEAAPPDFTIIILTNNTITVNLKSYEQYPGKLIILLGSSLADPDKYRAFQHYQWVDYRRQYPEVLDALAEDLLIFGTDAISNTFGTRQTPQSFESVLIPARVALWLMLQYVLINLDVAYLVKTLLAGPRNTIEFMEVLIIPPSLFISVWLINRIVRREITINRLLVINLSLSLIGYAIGLIVGLSQPPPYGYVRDFSGLPLILLSIGIGLLVGYFVGRTFLNAVVGGWLPIYVTSEIPFPGFRRDWPLWRRNLFAALVTGLFTFLIFSGQPVAGSANQVGNETQAVAVKGDELSINVPARWMTERNESAKLDAPIAAVFRRGSSPFSQQFADLMTGVMMPQNAPGTYIQAPDIDLTGAFSSAFSGGYAKTKDFTWMEALSASQRLSLTVFDFPPGALSQEKFSASLQTMLQILYATNVAPVQTQTLDKSIVRYQEAFDYRDSYSVTNVHVEMTLFDTPSVDFAIFVAGDPALINTEQASINAMIASAKLNPPPAPTPTMTPTPMPTGLPTLPELPFNPTTQGKALLTAMPPGSADITLLKEDTTTDPNVMTIMASIEVSGFKGKTLRVAAWPRDSTYNEYLVNAHETGPFMDFAGNVFTATIITPTLDQESYVGDTAVILRLPYNQLPCIPINYYLHMDVQYYALNSWHSVLVRTFDSFRTFDYTCP